MSKRSPEELVDETDGGRLLSVAVGSTHITIAVPSVGVFVTCASFGQLLNSGGIVSEMRISRPCHYCGFVSTG